MAAGTLPRQLLRLLVSLCLMYLQHHRPPTPRLAQQCRELPNGCRITQMLQMPTLLWFFSQMARMYAMLHRRWAWIQMPHKQDLMQLRLPIAEGHPLLLIMGLQAPLIQLRLIYPLQQAFLPPTKAFLPHRRRRQPKLPLHLQMQIKMTCSLG